MLIKRGDAQIIGVVEEDELDEEQMQTFKVLASKNQKQVAKQPVKQEVKKEEKSN